LVKRFNVWPLLPSVAVLFAGYGPAVHPPLELITAVVVASVLLAIVATPSALVPSAVAGPALLGGYVGAAGLAHTPLPVFATAPPHTRLAVAWRFRAPAAQSGPALASTPRPVDLTEPTAATMSPPPFRRGRWVHRRVEPGRRGRSYCRRHQRALHAAGTILLLWDENPPLPRRRVIGGRHA
jgi:hypothetical protein